MGKRKKRADGEGCVFRKRADLWGAYRDGGWEEEILLC
jgi:hypothetical protein